MLPELNRTTSVKEAIKLTMEAYPDWWPSHTERTIYDIMRLTGRGYSVCRMALNSLASEGVLRRRRQAIGNVGLYRPAA